MDVWIQAHATKVYTDFSSYFFLKKNMTDTVNKAGGIRVSDVERRMFWSVSVYIYLMKGERDRIRRRQCTSNAYPTDAIVVGLCNCRRTRTVNARVCGCLSLCSLFAHELAKCTHAWA